jgi:integrase
VATAHTRPQAIEALDDRKSEVKRTRHLVQQGLQPISEMTTADLMDRFHRHQKVRQRPTPYDRLDGILKTLKAGLPKSAKDINRRTVAEFIEKRSETVAPGTIAKEISTLKHALRLAIKWGELQANAAQGARLPKQPEGKTRYLTPSELKGALKIAPEWLRAPMALAACTGMRRGSLLALRWGDVDVKQRRIYLETTKTSAIQVLPISDAALQVLQSVPEGMSPDLIFSVVDAQLLSVTTRRVFAKIGIDDASFHTLRHTAASWMVQAGVDLYGVGKFLGHKTPRMT